MESPEYLKFKRAIVKVYTNKIKERLTEYIAKNYLIIKNYLFSEYNKMRFIADWDANFDENDFNEKLKRYKKEIKFYSKEKPPKWWSATINDKPIPWDVWRKRETESINNQIKNTYDKINERDNIKKLWGNDILDKIYNMDINLSEYGYEKFGKKYIPDFVLKKGEELFIVEVKSYSEKRGLSNFPKHQKEILNKVFDFGFKPMLVIVPIEVKCEVKEGEPRLEIASRARDF